MRTQTSLALFTLILSTAPAWACGTGDPTILLWILLAFAVGCCVFMLLALAPAFILAKRSRRPDRWGSFALGVLLAPLAAYQFGPLLPWDSLVSLVGLFALTSGAGVLPALVVRRVHPK